MYIRTTYYIIMSTIIYYINDSQGIIVNALIIEKWKYLMAYYMNKLINILDNQPPNQTTVPYPPNYSGPSEPPSQPQTQYSANPNTAPPPEFRVVYQPVIYSLSPNPTKTTCPTCHTSIKTTTISDHQPSAHLCCIVLCLLG